MEYLLKPSAIIVLFYLCYKLFLQRDTFFESNRWFLLSGLVIASCISFIVIPQYIEYIPIKYTSIASNISSESIVTPIEAQSFNYIQLLFNLYILGVLFFIVRLVIQMLSLRRVLKNGQSTHIQNFVLIESEENISPFSFFNYIVYNPTQFCTSELEHVINHEKAHSIQLHSVDNIIAQLACILLWFNPFVWFYKKALLQNLEFIADQKAQYVSPCEKSYQTVLLKASVQNHELAFTNNFYTSLIKKRIIMLHKSKSKKSNQIKLFIVLPLLALFIMSFNVKKVYVEVPEAEETELKDNNEIIEVTITKNTSDEDLEAIQETLKSKGITFTYSNVKRNTDGEITGINTKFKSEKNSSNYNISGDEGIKSFRFVSSDDSFSVGTIEKNTFYYKTKNGNAKSQSTNASSNVFVIEEINDDSEGSTTDVKVLGNNGNTFVTTKGKTFKFTSKDGDSNIFINESDEPIFIINGKRVKKSLFEDVDSDDIESIFVIKGEKALEKYGDDGKNGVIVMTRKGSDNVLIETDNNEDIIIESKSRIHIDSDGKNSPLIIVDGEVVGENEIQELNPNVIDKVEVIKDEESVKQYGKKGKDGVIKIFTKKNRGLNSTEDSIVIVESSNNSNTFHETHEIMIDKSMSNGQLDLKKKQLKEIGIDAKFSKVKRNKAGEITSIKISLDDNNGSKSSASWREKTQAIPKIIMGKQGKKLFINSI